MFLAIFDPYRSNAKISTFSAKLWILGRLKKKFTSFIENFLVILIFFLQLKYTLLANKTTSKLTIEKLHHLVKTTISCVLILQRLTRYAVFILFYK